MRTKILISMLVTTLMSVSAKAQETIAFYTECTGNDCLMLKGPEGEEKVTKEPAMSLTTDELADAKEESDHSGMQQVVIRFNEFHAKQFAELTEQIKGKRLHIVINGEVIMSPVVQNAIQDGGVAITAGATRSNDRLINKLPQLKLKMDERKRATETKERNKALGLAALVVAGALGSLVFLFRNKKKV